MLIIGACFFACKNNGKKIHKFLKGQLIQSFGIYIDKANNQILEVSNNNGLLKYSFLVKKDTIIKNVENTSVYLNWGLYLDTSNNLWVNSSDIGSWVWLKKNGTYVKQTIKSLPKTIKIPVKFYNSLSISEQKAIN